ncbi:hypothetical protein N7532_003173 [Penicillium argentinense]|uniref:Uncharacterized protein n=1 Tax=Penicillium argentinense TaxID=1131581 RepID=A0A9W9KDR3_9EURO|nr:uncharacterized protein N7532_003173 [Penicillium argentinense]KAJ5102644.1 hypothetical protein N7532_003173 [Penicillium argentinense]
MALYHIGTRSSKDSTFSGFHTMDSPEARKLLNEKLEQFAHARGSGSHKDTHSDDKPPSRDFSWILAVRAVQQHLAEQVNRARSNAAARGPKGTSLPSNSQAVVDSELTLVDTKAKYPPDARVFEELAKDAPDCQSVLANLYWRSVRQALVWDIFQLLLHEGLVDWKCLTRPISIPVSTHDTDVVSSFLTCFPELDMQLRFPADPTDPQIPLQSQTDQWLSDVEWLATIIVRCGTPLADVVTVLEKSTLVDDVDRTRSWFWEAAHPNFRIIFKWPQERAGPENEYGYAHAPKDVNTLGFWLPHGLSKDHCNEQVRDCLARGAAIEKAYREAMAPNLPDGLVAIDFTGIDPAVLDPSESDKDESLSSEEKNECQEPQDST